MRTECDSKLSQTFINFPPIVVLEFYAFMTPEPEAEYYKSIDEHFFDGEEAKPIEEELFFGLSRFEKVKAGQIRVRTVHTEISTSIK